MERIVAGVAMCIAFVVMASVFSPAPSHGELHPEGETHHEPASVDPHEDLLSLGSIEHGRFMVRMWSTTRGPRYSVYDIADGTELGVLLSLEQVDVQFPELDLGSLDHGTKLMLAEPAEH